MLQALDLIELSLLVRSQGSIPVLFKQRFNAFLHPRRGMKGEQALGYRRFGKQIDNFIVRNGL